jgi:serine/threonine protein kinase
MHEISLAHLDIKPGNIIYSLKNKCYKLIDFGQSMQYDEDVLTK